MDPAQTLHAFVLNLLCDATARAAFLQDPEQALHGAGLSDISASDVQEVLPLVLDFAPTHHLTAPIDGAAAGGFEPSGGSSLGAVDQLKALTENLSVGQSPLQAGQSPLQAGQSPLTGSGDVTNAAAGATALTQGGTDPFCSSTDLSHTLDKVLSHLPGSLGHHGDLLPGEHHPGLPAGAPALPGTGDVTNTLNHTVDDVNGNAANVFSQTFDDAAGNAANVLSHGSDTLAGVVDHGADDLGHGLHAVHGADHHVGSVVQVHDVVSDIGTSVDHVGNCNEVGILSGNGNGNDVHITH